MLKSRVASWTGCAGPAKRWRRGPWGVSRGGAWFYGLVRLCGFGEQRGTRVNTSCDRVLLFPIRKHTWLLSDSEKKGNCHKVELLVDARRVAAAPEIQSLIPQKIMPLQREREYNPPLLRPYSLQDCDDLA